jgi:hypothetical protein
MVARLCRRLPRLPRHLARIVLPLIHLSVPLPAPTISHFPQLATFRKRRESPVACDFDVECNHAKHILQFHRHSALISKAIVLFRCGKQISCQRSIWILFPYCVWQCGRQSLSIGIVSGTLRFQLGLRQVWHRKQCRPLRVMPRYRSLWIATAIYFQARNTGRRWIRSRVVCSRTSSEQTSFPCAFHVPCASQHGLAQDNIALNFNDI